MFSLQDLLGQEQGNQAVDQLSQNLGSNHTAVNSAIQMALPLLLSGLAKNASTPQGAENLNGAIEQHHDGSLLDNLSSFLGGGVDPQASGQTNGVGILGHILGDNQTQAAQQVSEKSGLDLGQVTQLLITLAPIVMGFLGKQKQQQNLDAGGLSNWLGGQNEQIQQSPQGGFLSGILDRDGDGSSIDDIAGMAMNYLRK